LWAALRPARVLPAHVIAVGVACFLVRDKVERAQDELWSFDGAEGAYRSTIRGTERVAADVTAFTQRGSLPAYLSTILVSTAVLAGGALLAYGVLPGTVRPWDNMLQLAVVLVIGTAAVLAARARRRLKAVLLLGVS